LHVKPHIRKYIYTVFGKRGQEYSVHGFNTCRNMFISLDGWDGTRINLFFSLFSWRCICQKLQRCVCLCESYV